MHIYRTNITTPKNGDDKMYSFDFYTLILSSFFEKLVDADEKTLVCKNRNPKKIAWHSKINSISPDLWRRSHPRARTRFWHCWWLFFSWSKIFSLPFNKHTFSYNTVFNGFFEDKSNVVKLGSRPAEFGGTVKIYPRKDVETERKEFTRPPPPPPQQQGPWRI